MMNMQTPSSVMGVTETWLNDATSELVNIIGHNFMSNHRISNQVEESVFMDHPCGPGPWTPSRSRFINYPCGPPLVLCPGLTLIRCTPNLTSNKKCPFKSKHLLLIFNNKVRVKVALFLALGKCSS